MCHSPVYPHRGFRGGGDIMIKLYNYDVFISHSSEDTASARRLADKLNEFDFLCSWGTELIPKQMIDVMEDSAVCLLLYGAGGNSPWFDDTIRAAIQNRIERMRGAFRVIPVLLPGATGSEEGEMVWSGGGIERSQRLAIEFIRFESSLDETEAIQYL